MKADPGSFRRKRQLFLGGLLVGFVVIWGWTAASGKESYTFEADNLAPDLWIDASQVQGNISPYIYGINFADENLAGDLQLPVNRWGGNATTRFNWQNDTSNRASDWFFENIPNANPSPGDLPDGSAADHFVEQNLRTGTATLLTLPMIGWTPAGRAVSCGFSVSKYGSQMATDPWQPDCGNGVHPDGVTPITGNDPLDTSMPITETFVQNWISHLTEKYGFSTGGGVPFYNLDNEPMLWNETHRDVHPGPAGYEEVRDLTIQYAAAIKASDPGAQLLGPTVWGWTAYFYSALDWDAGGSWWTNPVDRDAHGGEAFLPWYLQQLAAYEAAEGVRLLDYLDVHYYPQAPGVALSAAGDPATQALRLRSTRSLWDPAYVDESWIGGSGEPPVELIPRMQRWIEDYYPGTKLAITEYNWGALDHINGALAQADILGIFGREGVDLATLWAPPASGEPGAFAFRIYRNYDDQGNKFGEVSLVANSADQEQLAIYAAERIQDRALTVVVINKTSVPLTSEVNLSGFVPAPGAQVYRYSAGNLDEIESLAPQAIGPGGFTAEFPAASITLFVIPPLEGTFSFDYLPAIMR